MKVLPTILRNSIDKTITLSHPQSTYSLIWLHGLGDTSEGFSEFFAHPLSPLYSGARIRLIQAPERSMSLFPERCHSWYDIKSLDRSMKEDDVYSIDDINESVGIIDKYVKEEVEHWEGSPTKTYPYHRVFVGGFSQGCAMALKYGMECERPLAGVVGLSGFLFRNARVLNLGKTNVLLNHGDEDQVVKLEYSNNTYQRILGDPKVKHEVIRGL